MLLITVTQMSPSANPSERGTQRGVAGVANAQWDPQEPLEAVRAGSYDACRRVPVSGADIKLTLYVGYMRPHCALAQNERVADLVNTSPLLQ